MEIETKNSKKQASFSQKMPPQASKRPKTEGNRNILLKNSKISSKHNSYGTVGDNYL